MENIFSSHIFSFEKGLPNGGVGVGMGKSIRISGDTAGSWFKKIGDFVEKKLGGLPQYDSKVLGSSAVFAHHLQC